MSEIELSVVAPVYHEEDIIEDFYRELCDTLRKLALNYEIIFVDDGSGPATIKILRHIADNDPKVKVIELSRNFGHQVALTAGLDHATGDAVITIDSDLQHPPALIPALIDNWKKGYDIVYAIRKDVKGATLFKKATASMFYALMSKITDVEMDANCADFRLMSRKAVEGFKKIRENTRFIRGIVGWMGYRKLGIPFEAGERKKGRSKYTIRKMMKFALNGILSFSVAPIRWISIFGLLVSSVSALYLLRVIYFILFTKETVPDLLPITSIILFLVGAQMLMLGIIGEYIAEVFTESKKRPLYLVDNIYSRDKGSL